MSTHVYITSVSAGRDATVRLDGIIAESSLGAVAGGSASLHGDHVTASILLRGFPLMIGVLQPGREMPWDTHLAAAFVAGLRNRMYRGPHTRWPYTPAVGEGAAPVAGEGAAPAHAAEADRITAELQNTPSAPMVLSRITKARRVDTYTDDAESCLFLEFATLAELGAASAILTAMSAAGETVRILKAAAAAAAPEAAKPPAKGAKREGAPTHAERRVSAMRTLAWLPPVLQDTGLAITTHASTPNHVAVLFLAAIGVNASGWVSVPEGVLVAPPPSRYDINTSADAGASLPWTSVAACRTLVDPPASVRVAVLSVAWKETSTEEHWSRQTMVATGACVLSTTLGQKNTLGSLCAYPVDGGREAAVLLRLCDTLREIDPDILVMYDAAKTISLAVKASACYNEERTMRAVLARVASGHSSVLDTRRTHSTFRGSLPGRMVVDLRSMFEGSHGTAQKDNGSFVDVHGAARATLSSADIAAIDAYATNAPAHLSQGGVAAMREAATVALLDARTNWSALSLALARIVPVPNGAGTHMDYARALTEASMATFADGGARGDGVVYVHALAHTPTQSGVLSAAGALVPLGSAGDASASASASSYKGGAVLECETGFYAGTDAYREGEFTYTLDVRSMYPSIVLAAGIDPGLCVARTLTTAPGTRMHGVPRYTPDGDAPDIDAHVVPDRAQSRFVVHKQGASRVNILIDAMGMLTSTRAHYERAGDAVAARATKMIANATIGTLGHAGGVPYSIPTAAAITAYGRAIINIASNLVTHNYESAHCGGVRVRVLTGDTDSITIGVSKSGLGAEDALAWAVTVQAWINRTVARVIKVRKGAIRFRVQTAYDTLLLFSAKQYAGAGHAVSPETIDGAHVPDGGGDACECMLTDPTAPCVHKRVRLPPSAGADITGAPEYIVKGLMSIRRDFSGYTRTLYDKALHALMRATTPDDTASVINTIIEDIHELMIGRVDPSMLIVSAPMPRLFAKRGPGAAAAAKKKAAAAAAAVSPLDALATSLRNTPYARPAGAHLQHIRCAGAHTSPLAYLDAVDKAMQGRTAFDDVAPLKKLPPFFAPDWKGTLAAVYTHMGALFDVAAAGNAEGEYHAGRDTVRTIVDSLATHKPGHVWTIPVGEAEHAHHAALPDKSEQSADRLVALAQFERVLTGAKDTPVEEEEEAAQKKKDPVPPKKRLRSLAITSFTVRGGSSGVFTNEGVLAELRAMRERAIAHARAIASCAHTHGPVCMDGACSSRWARAIATHHIAALNATIARREQK